MAEMNFFDNFATLWAQNGELESIDDNQYKQGWAYIGATPPAVEQFNKVQQIADQKAAWLFAQLKALAEQGGFELASGVDYALTRGIAATIQRGAAVVGVDTGTANAYVVDYSPAVEVLADGMMLWFKVNKGNTGASTLNVNGLGARALVGMAHSALHGGELVTNGKALAVWKADANSWVLINCSGGALQVAPATAEDHAMQLSQATGRLLRTSLYLRIGGVQQVSVNRGTPTITGALAFNALDKTSFVEVELVGGGGGGGGARATGAGQVSIGAGGGGGSYGRGYYSKADADGVAVTVGAGSLGGTGANGGSGGTTSFGPLLSAPGGHGGQALGPSSPPLYAVCVPNGPATGGQIVASGTRGFTHISPAVNASYDGDGGSSYFGGGGSRSFANNGGHAQSPGAGGGGTSNDQNAAAVRTGGGGGNGVVIVREYA